jgi:competence protein ComEC
MQIISGANHWIAATVLAERDRWLLWLPVFLGAGTGLYFGLETEPPPWIGLALLSLAILALIGARRLPGFWPIAIAAAVTALGFNAAA